MTALPSRPLIAAVGYRLPAGRVTRWDTGAFAVPESYVKALRRAGARAAILCAADDWSGAGELERFDGLLLVGGGDVEPGRYGAAAHPADYGLDPERDAEEIGTLQAADRAGLPTLAICRGAQVLNVAFGGTLLQHLPDVPNLLPHRPTEGGPAAMHAVKLLQGSRLAAACDASEATGLSHHHQGFDRLGEGLSAVAWSDDGLVEAIERQDGWMLGVQWHPEETAAHDPAQQGVFDAFVAEAGRRTLA
ncbi:MAG: gamma-glutamyl-gamma-aminobutyrate hydrolase family protein [Actinobacteria bacterium]|nr:gamma-glutamyl-gamma-aminobutyrate hydrolase family protein [Actinomycetota bacterium]